MRIDRATVEHVAALARLGLTEEEVQRLTGQLSAILEAVGTLQAVDTSAIPPTASILDLQDVMREDELRPGLSSEEVLQNAPERERDFFRVRAVFEET
jgi:aspartyl-tRNA(Asn)/glutamyl-tRNA(Gln) amidotransferase subunit C